ncbi:MAG: energy transducer TonB [Flavitalea sp.]
MKYLFLFLVLALSTNVNAQKKDTVQKYLDQHLQFTQKSRAVFPAVAIKTNDAWFVKAMYPDTTVLVLAYFKDKNQTIKNGPYKLFHRRNVLAMEGHFANDLQEGPWKYYYPNGQMKDSGVMINNVMIENWKSWDEKGNLIASVNYMSQPGSVRAILPKGSKTLLPKTSPVPGHKDGLSMTYHPNGHVKDSIYFRNDNREGIAKSWYENGQLETSGAFKNDSLNGDWTYYRDNGVKSTDETYRNGKLQAMTCYDSAGNKAGSLCSILKPPVPVGDFDSFEEYMLDNVFWPKNIDPEVQGIVKVEFIVTKKGEIKNFKVVESPDQLLSDEVTRFFATIEEWSPAVSHNRVIDFPMQMEVPFLR